MSAMLRAGTSTRTGVAFAASRTMLRLWHGGIFRFTWRWQRCDDHPGTRHQAAEILKGQRLPGILDDRPTMFAMLLRQTQRWRLNAPKELGDGLLAKSSAAIDAVGDIFSETGQQTDLANTSLLPELPHGPGQ